MSNENQKRSPGIRTLSDFDFTHVMVQLTHGDFAVTIPPALFRKDEPVMHAYAGCALSVSAGDAHRPRIDIRDFLRDVQWCINEKGIAEVEKRAAEKDAEKLRAEVADLKQRNDFAIAECYRMTEQRNDQIRTKAELHERIEQLKAQLAARDETISGLRSAHAQSREFGGKLLAERDELQRGLEVLRERYTNLETHAETQRLGWHGCIEKLAQAEWRANNENAHFKLADRALSARNETIAALERQLQAKEEERRLDVKALKDVIEKQNENLEALRKNVTHLAVDSVNAKQRAEAAEAALKAQAKIFSVCKHPSVQAVGLSKITIENGGSIEVSGENLSIIANDGNVLIAAEKATINGNVTMSGELKVTQ